MKAIPRINRHYSLRRQRRGRSRVRGFTLVETVIAIGIVSTVMVALMGMLPEGVKMMSESSQRTVGARIANELIGRVQLADFDDASDFEAELYYFDDQGTAVNSGDLSRVFTAQVTVDQGSVTLPGARPSDYLKRIIVKVSDNPGVPNFADNVEPRDYLRYSTIIVDTTEDRNR